MLTIPKNLKIFISYGENSEETIDESVRFKGTVPRRVMKIVKM